MDKKELLKRWALAYIEPSLFYVPWRNNKEGHITIKSDQFPIIGGIFTFEGKLITKVEIKTSIDGWFQMNIKKGTYIYKEAVSPVGCELSDDVIFTVNSGENTYINLKHNSTRSYYTRQYKMIAAYSRDPISTYRHYGYYNWVLQQINESGQLIRTINDMSESANEVPSTIYPYSNNISNHDYYLRLLNQSFPNTQIKRWRIEFEWYVDNNIISSKPNWNDRDLGFTTVRQSWTGKHMSFLFECDDDEVKKKEWISTATFSKIYALYEFIVDNKVPPSIINSKLRYEKYDIWAYENQYYSSGAECGYNGIPLVVYLFTGQTDVTYTYPEEMLLSENVKFSEKYFIRNNMSDISKYFHKATLGVSADGTRLTVTPDSCINQTLLEIIETGGET